VPSCSIRDDGLVTCFAGCARSRVLAALDALGFRDDALQSAAPYDWKAEREAGIRRAQGMWDDAQPPWWPKDDHFAVANREHVQLYLGHRGITLPAPIVMR
jgi:hypothetical protein